MGLQFKTEDFLMHLICGKEINWFEVFSNQNVRLFDKSYAVSTALLEDDLFPFYISF